MSLPAKLVVVDLENKELLIDGEKFDYPIATDGWSVEPESDAVCRVSVTFYADAVEIRPWIVECDDADCTIGRGHAGAHRSADGTQFTRT